MICSSSGGVADLLLWCVCTYTMQKESLIYSLYLNDTFIPQELLN